MASKNKKAHVHTEGRDAGVGHDHDHSHDHDHDHADAHDHDHDHGYRSSLLIYSPAGVVAKSAALRKAMKRLNALGFEASLDDDATARHQRFAGTDEARLAAIHRVAARAPGVALASRGGYGLTRLLDGIDWKAIAASVESGTRWVGHSDVTVLQLGLLAHTGAASWAGPMANGDFGSDELDEITADCFREAMTGELEAVGFRTAPGLEGLEAKGVLWGGNLAMVCSLLGTKHMPKVKGGILFLEDVNEHPYRVERALLQLQQAGVLDAQKAVLLGAFTEWRKSPLDRGYNLKTAIEQVRAATKTPILTGLPFGHVPTKLTLPVGRRVQLAVEGREAFIGWAGH